MAFTATSGLPSAKTLRLASARRRLRAFSDQIAELGTSDFAHLDGKDALTFIKGYSLELREVLERLTPEASEASVNEACAQTSLMVSRYTDILGFILRSEEHTSELQSLMRISYAVFCLKKKIKDTNTT